MRLKHCWLWLVDDMLAVYPQIMHQFHAIFPMVIGVVIRDECWSNLVMDVDLNDG